MRTSCSYAHNLRADVSEGGLGQDRDETGEATRCAPDAEELDERAGHGPERETDRPAGGGRHQYDELREGEAVQADERARAAG